MVTILTEGTGQKSPIDRKGVVALQALHDDVEQDKHKQSAQLKHDAVGGRQKVKQDKVVLCPTCIEHTG